jgi:predicted dehydrogenase
LLAKGFSMAYTLLCERATLEFDLARGGDAMQVTEQGKAPATIKYDGPDGYASEVRYMVDCVQAGKRPAIVTAHDGMTALQICEAEEKSVQTGQVVKV